MIAVSRKDYREELSELATALLSLAMKPKVYKIGYTWILWVPRVGVYRFTAWKIAMKHALDPEALHG